MKEFGIASSYRLTKGGCTITTIEVSAKIEKTLSVEKEGVENFLLLF